MTNAPFKVAASNASKNFPRHRMRIPAVTGPVTMLIVNVRLNETGHPLGLGGRLAREQWNRGASRVFSQRILISPQALVAQRSASDSRSDSFSGAINVTRSLVKQGEH